jgi:hypothetical protein
MDATEEMSPANVAWENLAAAIRRACSLHHQGRDDEALRAAQEELPRFIEQWTDSSEEHPAWKRRRLLALIMEESRRLGEPVLLRQMLMARFASATSAIAGARAVLMGQGQLGGGISHLGAKVAAKHPEPAGGEA